MRRHSLAARSSLAEQEVTASREVSHCIYQSLVVSHAFTGPPSPHENSCHYRTTARPTDLVVQGSSFLGCITTSTITGCGGAIATWGFGSTTLVEASDFDSCATAGGNGGAIGVGPDILDYFSGDTASLTVLSSGAHTLLPQHLRTPTPARCAIAYTQPARPPEVGFTNCSANLGGGGAISVENNDDAAHVTIRNSDLSHLTAQRGGALGLGKNCDWDVSSTSFLDCVAAGGGGVAYGNRGGSTLKLAQSR